MRRLQVFLGLCFGFCVVWSGCACAMRRPAVLDDGFAASASGSAGVPSTEAPFSPSSRLPLKEFREAVRAAGEEERLALAPEKRTLPSVSLHLLTLILPNIENASVSAAYQVVGEALLARPRRWVEIYTEDALETPVFSCNLPRNPFGDPLGEACGKKPFDDLLFFSQRFSWARTGLEDIAIVCSVGAKQAAGYQGLSEEAQKLLDIWRTAFSSFQQTWDARPSLDALKPLVRELRLMKALAQAETSQDELEDIIKALDQAHAELEGAPKKLEDFTSNRNILATWRSYGLAPRT